MSMLSRSRADLFGGLTANDLAPAEREWLQQRVASNGPAVAARVQVVANNSRATGALALKKAANKPPPAKPPAMAKTKATKPVAMKEKTAMPKLETEADLKAYLARVANDPRETSANRRTASNYLVRLMALGNWKASVSAVNIPEIEKVMRRSAQRAARGQGADPMTIGEVIEELTLIAEDENASPEDRAKAKKALEALQSDPEVQPEEQEKAARAIARIAGLEDLDRKMGITRSRPAVEDRGCRTFLRALSPDEARAARPIGGAL